LIAFAIPATAVSARKPIAMYRPARFTYRFVARRAPLDGTVSLNAMFSPM
jgi:hypothetical protein